MCDSSGWKEPFSRVEASSFVVRSDHQPVLLSLTGVTTALDGMCLGKLWSGSGKEMWGVDADL